MGNDAGPPPAQPKGFTLSILPILIGMAAGVFAGLLLGDDATVFRPLGQIYLMLLEVAVYPYLIASLLHGLSSMTQETAWRLFRAGWPWYLFIWGVTLGMLWLLSLGIPQPQPTHLATDTGSTSMLVGQLVTLLVPSDIFTALSQNYVPAVVLFCIFFGIAFQKVKDKQALLSILDALRQASFNFWTALVKLMPWAVFALTADAAGSARLSNLGSIGLFVFLFMLGVVLLVFWIVPGCLHALTPLRFPEVMTSLRPALIVAIVTALPASALPIVMEATRKLAEKCAIEDPQRDDVARTHLSVAYPLAQLGNFFVYLFIIFAASQTGNMLSSAESAILPILSLLSCFGTPAGAVNAISFIGNAFHLPASIADLYVELMTVLRYGQVVASVMGFAFLSFIVVLAYYGKVKIRWGSLLGVLASGGVVALGCALGAKVFYLHATAHRPDPYLSFTLDPALTQDVSVAFAENKQGDASIVNDAGHGTIIERIRQTGTLTVGYNAGVIPFCYRNAQGDLVGYDVAFAYQLARQMHLKLRFVPFDWKNLETKLSRGEIDIAMSGIYLTRERVIHFGVTTPYFESPLAFFMPKDRGGEFLSRKEILARPELRVGIFENSVLDSILKNTFPKATIVVQPEYDKMPDFARIDAAFWSLAQAEAFAAAHPGIVAVAPPDLGNPLLFAYVTPPEADEFLKLINYWMLVNKDSDFEKAQKAYWIQRIPRPDPEPRWSILRAMTGSHSQ